MKRKLIVFKSRIRVFLACALYLAAQMLPKKFRKNYSGRTRVLVFHHVDNAARFQSIVATLKKKYNFISFQQYLDGDISLKQINVIIALDDGYQSWYTAAMPIFREFSIAPLLFINSDFVGLDKDAGEKYCCSAITTWPEPGLTWEQVRHLEAVGAEIGGHSRGHVSLVNSSNIENIFPVIDDDRKEISSALGHAVRSFAYPFGRYDKRSVEAVAAAGYEFAFTSDSGFLDGSAGSLLLKRSNIGLRPPLVVCAMMEGWPDYISDIVSRLKGKRIRACTQV